jgi:mRNA-degrading endonuclease toxin of MazEF toxin-antitoxin module
MDIIIHLQPGEYLIQKKDSIVNLSQIRNIDKKRLIPSKIASLSNELIGEVDEALKNSLALR